ncbi:non-heme iron oxygenase ferredoxin subunit [Pseudomarimonas salicorniae]|uniref:Non-heme iron oxygenase ferredoxin subunit n=1 Tax=Pseudomarimonas salicorniae TaxID=2933270 RepID=A0ABT0GEX0_9GAMM|nr:non-heme iron oxygenase ferredoxin subunit [Lysobacter sp. CAU 1642]
MSGEWVRVCDSAAVLPGELHTAWMDEVPLVLFNLEGEIHVLRDQCSHEDYELSSGFYDPDEGSIECALHGAKFDVRDGRALCAPAYTPVEHFEARIADGGVHVRRR